MISRLTMACQHSFDRDLERGKASDNRQDGDSPSVQTQTLLMISHL